MHAHLLLVKLNPEQIAKAKEVNGDRKKITHALLCGESGQIFGTEKYCTKYYSVWKDIFPLIFDKSSVSDDCTITEFESTFDLVNILGEKHDSLKSKISSVSSEKKENKKSLWAKLFSRN